MSFEIKCMYPRRVNADMIQSLPAVRYTGEIVLVETHEALDIALAEISKEKILGFDTETRPNFSKGKQYSVSILQLAGEKKVWIIRLDPLFERLSDIFKILENPTIKKAGIAVQGDISALRSRCLFRPAGFVDVTESTSSMGVVNTGMRNLAALVFGERISKAAQLTNWASNNLTTKQIEYAATDAWISRRLFIEIRRVMEGKRIIIEPEPEPIPEKFNLRLFVHKTISKIFGRHRENKSDRQSRKGDFRKSGAGKGEPRNLSGAPKKRRSEAGKIRNRDKATTVEKSADATLKTPESFKRDSKPTPIDNRLQRRNQKRPPHNAADRPREITPNSPTAKKSIFHIHKSDSECMSGESK